MSSRFGDSLSLLDWLEYYDVCYTVVASDSFMTTDWFVMIHRKDMRQLVGNLKFSTGIYHIDLQEDDTYVDEAVQYDLGREEVKQFYQMMGDGKFLKVYQDEHGIIYELVRRSFRDYCWGSARRNKKRKKLRYGQSTEALQRNGDHRLT